MIYFSPKSFSKGNTYQSSLLVDRKVLKVPLQTRGLTSGPQSLQEIGNSSDVDQRLLLNAFTAADSLSSQRLQQSTFSRYFKKIWSLLQPLDKLMLQ